MCHATGSARWGASCPRQGSPTPTQLVHTKVLNLLPAGVSGRQAPNGRKVCVSTLDNLKKEAKRWLKALRGNDADARMRLLRVWPGAPAEPGLRDVQHALAREHQHESWTAFKEAIDTGARSETPSAIVTDKIAARFLEQACWDHHTHGAADHRMYDRAAQRLLAQHPGLADHSLFTAIVCGNLADVQRIVTERPAAVREPGGSRGWTPILYASFTRFTHPA